MHRFHTTVKRWLIPSALVVLLAASCAGEAERTAEPTGPALSARTTAAATNPSAAPTTEPNPTLASATPTDMARPTAASATPSTLSSATPIPLSSTLPPASPTTEPTDAPAPQAAWSYPIGRSGQPLGDGFMIRHGFQTENTWFNPGDWHTGEDWYALDGNTAGAIVYAVSAGEVVYAGANYPGRVVIVRHEDNLHSMYGHLDPALAVDEGQVVERGTRLGTVLRRDDDVPNHLHFEIRSFVTTLGVNGATPRYGYRCGQNCPPGPGYWPIDAPELPVALGWRYPTHVIARRADLPAGSSVVVASQPVAQTATLWSELADGVPAGTQHNVDLNPGARHTLLDVFAGAPERPSTSAEAYLLWYRLRLSDGREGWVQAAVPTTRDTGSDGRPSSVAFNLLPDVSGR